MSYESTSCLVIGFTMSQEDFYDHFTLVDGDDETVYGASGETFGDDGWLIKHLEKATGSVIQTHGNLITGDDLMISIECKAHENGSNELSFADVAAMEADCLKLRAKFKELYDLDLGNPVITTLASYG